MVMDELLYHAQLDATEDDLRAMFDVVCAAVAPKPKTAFQLLQDHKSECSSWMVGWVCRPIR